RAPPRYRATAPPPGGASPPRTDAGFRSGTRLRSRPGRSVWSSALCSWVPVVRVRSVLAAEVALEQIRRGIGVRVQRQRLDGHLRDRLADDRVLQRLSGILTPHERAVVGRQRTGHLRRVVAGGTELLDDGLAGVVLVVRGALGLGEIPRTADRPVEGV